MKRPLLSGILCAAAFAQASDAPPKSVSVAAKLRIAQAKLATAQALNAVLQSPLYSQFLAAQSVEGRLISEAEREAGCRIDQQALECAPEKK